MAQLLPLSFVASNTGLIYGKFGSAPVASMASGTWDFVLNSGAADGTNNFETRDKAIVQESLWLVSDTANQQVNVEERSLEEAAPASASGVAAL